MCRLCTGRHVAEAVDSYNDVDREIVADVDAEQGWGDADRVLKEPADDPLHNEGKDEAHDGLDWILFLGRLARIEEREVVLLIHEGDDNEEGAQSNDEYHEGLLPLWTHPLKADTAHYQEHTQNHQVWVQVENDTAVLVLHRNVDIARISFVIVEWTLRWSLHLLRSLLSVWIAPDIDRETK